MSAYSGPMLATGLLLVASPAQAHHSFADFDLARTITLAGTVTSVEWTSPHARLHVDVEGEDGAVVSWSVELSSPSSLSRKGWRRDELQAGDAVIVVAFPSRDDPGAAVARAVTDGEGRSLFLDRRKRERTAATDEANNNDLIPDAPQARSGTTSDGIALR